MPDGQGPKTVKGAQSDPNYVSRLLLDCVPVFHKCGSLTHFAMQSTVDLNWHQRFNGGLGSVANVCWGPKIIVTPMRDGIPGPQTVTHPSTNRARRRVTRLARPTTLPLRYATNRISAIYVDRPARQAVSRTCCIHGWTLGVTK